MPPSLSPEFRALSRSMPYARPLFCLAAPLQGLLLACVPVPKGLCARTIAIKRANGRPLRAEVFAPKGPGAPRPCLLFFHGGGFGYRAAPHHKQLALRLANDLGCVVVCPRYRRLPRHPFPAAKEDALAAYRFVCARAKELGADAQKIAVLGDSAGGALAAYAAAHDWGNSPRPCAQVLLYPVADALQSSPSLRRLARAPMWNAGNNAHMWAWYLQGCTEAQKREASPLTMPLCPPPPPAYVEVAECDCLRGEGLRFAGRLKALGGAVTVHEVPGAPHGFDLLQNAPATKDALHRRMAFLNSVWAT